MGSWGREDAQQGGGWRKEQSHIACGKAKKNYWGARQTTQPRVPAWEYKASKPLAVKTYRCCSGWRNSQPHRRAPWRDLHGPRTNKNLPTQKSAPEGPNLLMDSRQSD